MNNLRKSNLAKIASQIFKPANFKLKPGIIVTDSTSKHEKLKINGSRALSPSSLKLFKIVDVQHNGLSALCKDLKTRRVSTQSINNLRSLDLCDFLSLQIDPTHAFPKDLVDMSRLKNLHLKMSPESENVHTPDDTRTTRSGLSFYSSNTQPSKSILKNKNSQEDIVNFYSWGPSQKAASL